MEEPISLRRGGPSFEGVVTAPLLQREVEDQVVEAVLAPRTRQARPWLTRIRRASASVEASESSRASSIIARSRAAMTLSISATVSVAESTREYFSEPSLLCTTMRDFMA